ncbi:MAG TPA: amidohydrolase family protein [Cyclobacteriaceae bacterium]|nr:amidohydrolase family protein [Cyclobacteriaceae bacterium]
MRLLLLFMFVTGSVIAADTTRYEVISSGKITGKHFKWSDGNGHTGYHYEFNDRGRGPKIVVNLTTNTDGLVVERTGKGYDYFKAPVDELYTYSNGTAQWKNHIEDDKKQIDGKLLYSPLNSVPAEIEIALKALLKVPGHQLDVIPSGKLKATHIKNHSTKLDGLTIELELYSFSGSGGPPSYLWFNPRKEFFATISGWSSTILAGHSDLIPELKELQDELEEEYFYQQAKKLTEVPTEPVAIKNVNVLDVVKGKLIKGQTVIIEAGKISQIGKAKKVKVPATATIIDGANKTLMPGLWDNHVHYDMTQGLYHLAAGVTNVKDMGNSLDLPKIKKEVDEGALLGPEISVMSGFVDFAGPFAGPTGKIVSTLEEGLAGIDYYADHGYQQVKLYSSIPVDWVKPLAERAHQKNLKVVGHIPSFMTAERAVRDGYDQIIHMNMIMLNFLGDSIDTRSMGRFTKVGENARNVDLEGPAVKQFIALLKEKNTVVDPTIGIFEQMFVNKPGKLANGYSSVIGMFPAEFKRSFYYGGLPAAKAHELEYAASLDKMIKMIKVLHQNGITIVPGTDDFPGFALHRELELYAQAGLTNAEVLRAATLNSAKVAGKDNEVGTVEIGKKANLILIDGDPLKNISDIRKVELTIKNGNLYEPKALYASYGFSFWK